MAEQRREYSPRHLSPQEPRTTAPKPRDGKKPAPARKKAAAGAVGRRSARAKAGRPQAQEQKPNAAAADTHSGQLYRQSLLPTVEHVHEIDQRGLRAGLIWLLALPVLLLVIRRLTDSSRIAFLIVWIIGMFIISAALIFVAYADHLLNRFLKDAEQYVPEAEETELGGLLPTTAEERLDLNTLPVPPEVLRSMLVRHRERREAGMAAETDTPEEAAHLLKIEEWLHRLEQRRERETADEEHKADHKG